MLIVNGVILVDNASGAHLEYATKLSSNFAGHRVVRSPVQQQYSWQGLPAQLSRPHSIDDDPGNSGRWCLI